MIHKAWQKANIIKQQRQYAHFPHSFLVVEAITLALLGRDSTTEVDTQYVEIFRDPNQWHPMVHQYMPNVEH